MIDAGLKEWAIRSIADHCKVSPEQVGHLSVEQIHSADRRIYRLVPSLVDRAFVLKVRSNAAQKEADLDEHAAELEYQRLEEAYAIARNCGGTISMPVPVAIDPGRQAILTTWCSGKELRRLYYRVAWRWPAALSRLQGPFRQCGDWLGTFHNGSRRTVATAWAMEHRLRHLDRMITEIITSGHHSLSSIALERLRTIIGDGLTRSAETCFGRLHGNFTLRNILVSDGGVSPVDFEDSRDDALCMDAGQLVADLMLSAYRPYIRSGLRCRLARVFMAAYRQHVSVDIGQVRSFALYHVLAAYYEILARTAQQGKLSMLSAHQVRVFGSLLSRPAQAVELYT